MNEPTIRLHPSQGKVISSDKPEIFFIGGLGSGKSFVLGVFTFLKARIRGSVGFLGAPTKDVLRNATLKQVKAAWKACGIEEWKDYVIGCLPPSHWNVEPFNAPAMGQHGILTFRWGSYMVLDGLDNFNKHRGTEFDYYAVDEFRDVKQEARDVLNGRLRGQASIKAGVIHQGLWVTTPPEDFTMIEEAIQDLELVDSVFTSSMENQENLPENYISNLLRKYDNITAQREIFGKLVAANRSPWLHVWDKDKFTVPYVEHNGNASILVSFDFNLEPMTAGVIQFGWDWMKVIQEYEIPGDPSRIAEAIFHDWEGFDIYVTGDREGYTRQKAREDNSTMYDTILDVFEIGPENLRGPMSNLRLSSKHDKKGKKSSRTLCNGVLSHINLEIDTSCKGLIKDLGRARVDHFGNLIKDKDKRSAGLHHFDWFRYAIHTAFGDWFVR